MAVEGTQTKTRREYRNINVMQLKDYRQPLSAIVSIMHRISGFLLFLLLPFILYLLQESIRSEISFAHFQGIASHPLTRLVILAMDTHVGLDKDSARKSAVGVLVVTWAVVIVVALKLFGVF
jgi:succinate dehydrogenase / fumarate reductase cytochrome b subunit